MHYRKVRDFIIYIILTTLAIIIAGFLGFYLRQFKTIKQNHTKILQNSEEQASTFLRSLPYKSTEEFLSDKVSPLIPDIDKHLQYRIWDYHITNNEPIPKEKMEELINSNLKKLAIKEKTDKLMSQVQLSTWSKRFESYSPNAAKLKSTEDYDFRVYERKYIIPSDLTNQEVLKLYKYEISNHKGGDRMPSSLRDKLIFEGQTYPLEVEPDKDSKRIERIINIEWLSEDELIKEKEFELAILKR